MADEHPNVALLNKLDPNNFAAAAEIFAPDVVFHFFNPKLPDLQGAYHGLKGIRSFFEKMGARSSGTFKVEPVAATAVGDELVVVQTRNSLTLDGQPVTVDVVVVWRFVAGRITEVWDIPSVYTATERPQD